jgi:poly(beta-D-mannuronate) lyase
VRVLRDSLVLLFLCICTLPASAENDLQVSNIAELNVAIASAQPGDRIVMANGVWRDADILFDAQGEPERPITLVAKTRGKVILSGTSRLRIAGQWLIVDGLWFKDGALDRGSVIQFQKDRGNAAHHCRVTQTAITEYNPESKDVNYKWVSLYGTHNRVDHCYFRGQNHDGQTLVVWVGDGPNDHLIDHNYFAGRPPLGKNGGETLRIGTSHVSMNMSRTVVEHNLFEQCNGEIEIVSNKTCGNIYRYNTFRASEGMFTLRHGNACRVEGNFFLGKGTKRSGGVRVIGEDHLVVNNYFEGLEGTGTRSAITLVEGIPDTPLNGYWQVKRALVAFNTFVDCAQIFEVGNSFGTRGRVLPPMQVVIANNVAVGRPSAPLITQKDEKPDIRWVGNMYWGTELGMDAHMGLIRKNPMLEQREGIFRPSEKSPVIGSAIGRYGVLSDIDGQIRDKMDVGCDEYTAGAIQNRPLKPSEVGPAWMK